MKDNKKKSLLVITNVYPLPWQPTRGTYNKIQLDLLAREYDISIIVPLPIQLWLKHRPKTESNVKYTWHLYVPKIGALVNGPLMFLSIFLSCFGWIRGKAPEKLLACWAFPDGVAGFLLSKLLRIPFYLKVHGSDINVHTKYKIRKKQIEYIGKRANQILCVSQALKNKLSSIGVPDDRTTVIYNGVNADVFNANQQINKKEQLIFVGNIKRTKGTFEALEGFSKISKEYPELILVFIGDGPDLNELKESAAELKLSKRVIFKGSIPHDAIAAHIAESKALLLPSHAEGVPNVILESMSVGVPAVATAVGGIPEILIDGKNGFLVPEIDANAVAAKIKLALAQQWNSEEIVNMSKKFSWQKNAKQFEALLLK
jgi:glycosyltransferase involved in cell wall biosynthesis